MNIVISRYESEEIRWKIDVIFDNPELQEAYEITEQELIDLQKDVPVKGNGLSPING